MTTTAGHSFYIGPIGFFYNQVNDTGSWEPQVFFPLLSWELLEVCQRIPSISFGLKNKTEFQNFNFFIFHPILMEFLQNDNLYGLLMNHRKKWLFYFEKGSKSGPNSKILHTCNVYLTLEIEKQENYCSQHITVSNTLLCPAIYCVKQNTFVHTCLNIYLFNSLLSTCCDGIMLRSD